MLFAQLLIGSKLYHYIISFRVCQVLFLNFFKKIFRLTFQDICLSCDSFIIISSFSVNVKQKVSPFFSIFLCISLTNHIFGTPVMSQRSENISATPTRTPAIMMFFFISSSYSNLDKSAGFTHISFFSPIFIG